MSTLTIHFPFVIFSTSKRHGLDVATSKERLFDLYMTSRSHWVIDEMSIFVNTINFDLLIVNLIKKYVMLFLSQTLFVYKRTKDIYP